MSEEPSLQKCPKQWWNHNWFIYHDNALAHTALSMHKFLASKNMAVVPQPPYLPDLAPCDSFLFLRMKSQVKGCHFQNVSKIQEKPLTALHALQKCQFQQWQKCWTPCINSERVYYEGDQMTNNIGTHIFCY